MAGLTCHGTPRRRVLRLAKQRKTAQEIAERYRDVPGFAIDICNEPSFHSTDAALVKSFGQPAKTEGAWDEPAPTAFWWHMTRSQRAWASTNAAAYGPAGSPIRMSAELDNGTLALRVADQGIGLAPGEETKVFQKFYRGAQSRPGGTGLGLSIVRGFARAHRGDVSAENNPAGGATFTIRLPVETDKHPV